MEIKGTLTHIGDLVEGNGQKGPWKKQIFVIQTQEQYPKNVALLAWNERCNDVDALNLGDVISVSFDIESREFNGKWYTDLKAWKIQGANAAAPQAAQAPAPQPMPQPQNPFANAESLEPQGDDLPF